jgi:hypothetical protein
VLRHSLTAAALALATVTSLAVPGNAATANVNPYRRTVVHHVYTYEPAPNPYYYGPYYGPSYAPEYVPAAPITALPGAAVCFAFSLIGAC